MSRKPETALLRGELARLAAENRELRRMASRLEAALAGRVAALEAGIDRLRPEMAGRDRRLTKYENAHAPSSTGSPYNEKRAAFRKMITEGRCGNKDDDGGGPSPAGCRVKPMLPARSVSTTSAGQDMSKLASIFGFVRSHSGVVRPSVLAARRRLSRRGKPDHSRIWNLPPADAAASTFCAVYNGRGRRA